MVRTGRYEQVVTGSFPHFHYLFSNVCTSYFSTSPPPTSFPPPPPLLLLHLPSLLLSTMPLLLPSSSSSCPSSSPPPQPSSSPSPRPSSPPSSPPPSSLLSPPHLPRCERRTNPYQNSRPLMVQTLLLNKTSLPVVYLEPAFSNFSNHRLPLHLANQSYKKFTRLTSQTKSGKRR